MILIKTEVLISLVYSFIDMDKNKQDKITPLGLRSMARSIARSYGEDGAIVIVAGDETIHSGTWGLG